MIWLNGEWEDYSDIPTVSLRDSAHLYSDSTFTMLRTFNKRTFQLEAHVDRLTEGARLLGIDLPKSAAEIRQGHEDLLGELILGDPHAEEWRTCIEASRGALPIYGDDGPWVAIYGYPLSAILRGKSHFYDGVDAVISDVQAIPDACFPQTIKHHNRIHFRLAEQRAGDAWPILCNGIEVAEAPGANVAVVYADGTARSPAKNCLRGVSMRCAAGMLQSRYGIGAFAWGDVYPADLHCVDEAFFTCTPWSVLPIRSIDGRKLECPGPITRRLTEAWIESVGCDFVAQAKRWDVEE